MVQHNINYCGEHFAFNLPSKASHSAIAALVEKHLPDLRSKFVLPDQMLAVDYCPNGNPTESPLISVMSRADTFHTKKPRL